MPSSIHKNPDIDDVVDNVIMRELPRIKKRDSKAIRKHEFDYQMLQEFKKFSFGMQIAMDTQNEFLRKISCKLDGKPITPPSYNTKVNEEENKLEEFQDNQCDVVEHSIEVPQPPRDLYPYEVFMKREGNRLPPKLQILYDDALRLADGREDLAYWIYECRSVEDATRRAYSRYVLEYFKTNEEFNVIDLKNHYTLLDLTGEYTRTYLASKYERMKQFGS